MHGPTRVFWANLTAFSLKDTTVAVFDAPLPMTVGRYDLVGPSAERLYELTIRRSTFANNRARGLL